MRGNAKYLSFYRLEFVGVFYGQLVIAQVLVGALV